MGGGQQTQTQSQFQFQQKDPWGAAVPALHESLRGAMDAYNKTYNGPQVAGMDPNVTGGQNEILANSAGGLVSGGARSALGGLGSVYGNGGLSPLQMAGGAGAQGGLGYVNQAAGNLSPIASGAYLDPKNNPYFSGAMQDALDQARNSVSSQFSSSGRYGSGGMTDVMSRSLGNVATNAYANQYNQNMANMLSANNQLGSLGSQASGIGATLAGIGQQGVGNLQNAGGALSALGTAQNTDAANRMGVGGQRMDYEQQLIDAANQAPWAKVGNLAQIASGIGGLGGTSWGQSYGQTQTQQPGGIGNILGSVLGGIGGLGNIAKAGGFAALFSDERLKEDIRKVGKTDDGQNIYSYRYKAGGPKMLGLMAQEVMRKKPEAVMRDPDSGYLMVDYGKATA